MLQANHNLRSGQAPRSFDGFDDSAYMLTAQCSQIHPQSSAPTPTSHTQSTLVVDLHRHAGGQAHSCDGSAHINRFGLTETYTPKPTPQNVHTKTYALHPHTHLIVDLHRHLERQAAPVLLLPACSSRAERASAFPQPGHSRPVGRHGGPHFRSQATANHGSMGRRSEEQALRMLQLGA